MAILLPAKQRQLKEMRNAKRQCSRIIFSFLKTSFCAILVDAAAFVAWKGHENNENKFHIIDSFDHNLFPANNLHPRWVKSDKTKNVFRTSHKSNPVLVQSPKWRCQLQAPWQDPAEPEWTGKRDRRTKTKTIKHTDFLAYILR